MSAASPLPNEPHLQTTRVRFENVVVAVDLSASSAGTLKLAADLAHQYDSRLIVSHVAKPAERAERADLEARIDLWMKPYRRSGADYSIVLGEGDVVDEVSRMVRDCSADLLIIGTHAATNVERLVLGSTAEALFRSMSIPVLTSGPNVRHGAARFSSIVLPTDLQPHSFRAVQYAVSLSEEFGAALTLLHVLDPAEGPDAHKAADLRMQQLVPEDAGLWCRPVFKTETGDLTEAILATAERTHADLIVLAVTHARLLADHAHWSVVANVVRWAGCPVLTVRNHL